MLQRTAAVLLRHLRDESLLCRRVACQRLQLASPAPTAPVAALDVERIDALVFATLAEVMIREVFELPV